ncbi:hypothetical protein BH23ACT2_BH23ACT2_23240 [soil metagenome]
MVVGELGQRRDRFATDDVLLDVVLQATGRRVDEARSLLAKFGLGADHVARPSARLSPGERTRANLALFVARGVNRLVLDEPTNHLDLVAIEQLERSAATSAPCCWSPTTAGSWKGWPSPATSRSTTAR